MKLYTATASLVHAASSASITLVGSGGVVDEVSAPPLLGDGDHSSNKPRTLSTGHGILECHLTLCHGRRLHHRLAQSRQANIGQATSYAQDGRAHGSEVQHQEGALQASAVNSLQLQRSASFR